MGVFDEVSSELFVTYEVELSFWNRFLAGVPKDKGAIFGWLRTKAGVTEQHELAVFAAKTVSENGADLGVSVEEIRGKDPGEIYEIIDAVTERYAYEKSTQGFKVGEHGLYMESRYVKSMLKESANIVYPKEKWGPTGKGPFGYVAERVFPVADEIWLDADEPEGIFPWVGHPKDKHGRRGTFSLHEYFDKPKMTFQLKILASAESVLTFQRWGDIFTHAQENGLGAKRSQGFGRFEVTGWRKVA